MAKYDPLRDWLKRRRPDEIDLSFADIERMLGYMLPNSARAADWWVSHGEPGPREVQKRAWRDAGYEAVLLHDERVRFTRAGGREDGVQEPKSKAI